jgi:hypothetical protein
MTGSFPLARLRTRRAKDRDAVDAEVCVEVDQAVGACQIKAAILREGRCCDDEDA